MPSWYFAGPERRMGPGLQSVVSVFSGARYWRLLISGTTGAAAGVETYEIQMREVASGSNVATGGTASASSEFDGTTLAGNAFDGNSAGASPWWDSDFSDTWPQWIKYDFGLGVSKTIIEITWCCRNNLRCPNAFDIQYSTDNAAWTTYWSVSGKVSGDYGGDTTVTTFTKP